MMYWEKIDSESEERRMPKRKVQKISWNEAVNKAAIGVADYARKKSAEKGAPFYHEDELGRWTKEYPNGRRVEVIHDKSGKREVPLE